MKTMKKILAVALVVMSVLAIALPAMAETTKTVIATPNVNFRTSPGGDLIDRIPYDATVVEISTSIVSGVQWSYVRYNGTLGYVQTQYLSGGGSGGHPTSVGQAFGSYTLRQGQTSYYVKNLQLALNRCNLSTGTISTDGIFGSGTLAAVNAFQQKYGLEVDGLVGAPHLLLFLDISYEIIDDYIVSTKFLS